MSSRNVFHFYVFRGYFLEVIYYWLGITSLALLIMTVGATFFALAAAFEDADGLAWQNALSALAFAVAYRLSVIISKRAILRRIFITINAGSINITYPPFLLFSQKSITLQFRDVAGCYLLSPNSRIRNTHLVIHMLNGARYRFTDKIRWLQKIEAGEVCSIETVEETIRRFKNHSENSDHTPPTP